MWSNFFFSGGKPGDSTWRSQWRREMCVSGKPFSCDGSPALLFPLIGPSPVFTCSGFTAALVPYLVSAAPSRRDACESPEWAVNQQCRFWPLSWGYTHLIPPLLHPRRSQSPPSPTSSPEEPALLGESEATPLRQGGMAQSARLLSLVERQAWNGHSPIRMTPKIWLTATADTCSRPPCCVGVRWVTFTVWKLK